MKISLLNPSRRDVDLALLTLRFEQEKREALVRDFWRRQEAFWRQYAPKKPAPDWRGFVLWGFIMATLLACWWAQ